MIFQRIQTSIAKKPYFCDFSGEGSGPPVPPLDPPMSMFLQADKDSDQTVVMCRLV